MGPIQSGHLKKTIAALLTFQFVFQLSRLGMRENITLPDQIPRAASLGPLRDSAVVLPETGLRILAEANVKPSSRISQNVNLAISRHERLVAGAGFEPAAFRL